MSDYSSSVYFLLWLIGLVFHPILLASAGISFGLVFYVLGWRSLFRQWRIISIPVSRIRSAAAGLVKLRGRVLPASPDAVPSGFCLDGYIRNPDNLKNTRWRKLVGGTVQEPFFLDDGSGKVLVVPGNAGVLGVDSRLIWPFSGSRVMRDLGRLCARHGVDFLFEEIQYPDAGVIREGDWLVLIGDARSVGGSSNKWRNKVSDLLRKWLGNPVERVKLDLNRDGYIDEMELENAKERAGEIAAAESVNDVVSGPELVVGRPHFGRFLITKGSEKDFIEDEGRPLVTVLLSTVLMFAGLWYLPRQDFWTHAWSAVKGGAVILALLLVLRVATARRGNAESG